MSDHDDDDENDWHMLAEEKKSNGVDIDDNDNDDIEIDIDDNDNIIDDDDFDTLRMSSAASIKSTDLSSTTNTTTSTNTNPSSAPLPSSSASSATSTTSSLKSYYNSRKNKLIASLYNAYNNYSPGSLWQLHPTEPIWLLGRVFAPSVGVNAHGHAPAATSPVANGNNHVVVVNDDGSVVRSGALAPHLREFADYFRSVLFCSYRKNFPRIAGTHFTTDAGWGCMLRTGQMLLARAVLVQLSPLNWQLTDADVQSPFSVYRRVVRWFNDEPHDAPFSIHQFIEAQRLACARRGDAHQMQLAAGSWFTPTEVACIIRDVIRINGAVLDNLEVYVARDGELNRRAIEQLAGVAPAPDASDGSAERPWRHVVLLIPVRLGVDALHESYVQPLRKLLTMPQTLGVFGGRPRQSLYFVGVQADDVLFLDPHLVQSWQPPHAKFDDATNHLAAPQRMRLRDVDPSMTIGFFLRTRADFDMVLAQLDAFAANMVHFVSVVDAPVVPEQQLGDVAPTTAAIEQARIATLSRRIKSQPEGSIVRRRSERTTSDPPPNPPGPTPVDVVAVDGGSTSNGSLAAAATTTITTSPREASTTSQLDISESRWCDDELCVHALDAGGALTQWLQRKKWSIVQHQPATGKSLVGSSESSPTSSDAGGGLLARWRAPRRDATGSSDDDVELKSDGATSLKHVATAFIVAHAQGVHVHFRPQLEVMFEREELHQPRWRVTVRYYAHLKPGTASALTLLTAGLSLMVAANTVSKHAREAPAWSTRCGRCSASTAGAPIRRRRRRRRPSRLCRRRSRW
jgi:cysteine protease ATG4